MAKRNKSTIKVYLTLPPEAAAKLYAHRNEAELRLQAFPLSISSISYPDMEEGPKSGDMLQSAVEQLPMDGQWSLERLGGFSRDFINLYSVMYGFHPNTALSSRYGFRAAFERHSWAHGMDAGAFYSRVRSAVPASHRVLVAAINYNSPGAMSLKLVPEVADEVRTMVRMLVPTSAPAHRTYAQIHKDMSKRRKNLLSYDVTEGRKRDLASMRKISDADAKFVEESYLKLAERMRFPHADRLLQMSGSRFAALKLLMSLYRRALSLAKLERAHLMDYDPDAEAIDDDDDDDDEEEGYEERDEDEE